MRLPALLVCLAIATPAHADGFGEFLAGLAIPASNNNWTNLVSASPKLAARGGVMSGMFGGMLALDWTPESLENGGSSFVVGSTSAALHRFRILASGVFRHRIAPRLTISARAGGGIDIAHASGELDVLGVTRSASDTDVGYAFEFGGGIWFDVGATQLGFELAIPIGHHDKQVQQAGDLPFNYTSVDVDLLFAVRI